MPEPSKKFISYIKNMVFEKSGKILSEEEAWDAANNLIGFFEVLHKIDCRTKNDKHTGNQSYIE
ncbi:MAG: hypothetical protein HGA36_00955 [Candidatus Moranbacteria bacterium]|nr:hypothetical protein [Candidatus Moranbacteria bacterium]